jgi:hypothetical protein
MSRTSAGLRAVDHRRPDRDLAVTRSLSSGDLESRETPWRGPDVREMIAVLQ